MAGRPRHRGDRRHREEHLAGCGRRCGNGAIRRGAPLPTRGTRVEAVVRCAPGPPRGRLRRDGGEASRTSAARPGHRAAAGGAGGSTRPRCRVRGLPDPPARALAHAGACCWSWTTSSGSTDRPLPRSCSPSAVSETSRSGSCLPTGRMAAGRSRSASIGRCHRDRLQRIDAGAAEPRGAAGHAPSPPGSFVAAAPPAAHPRGIGRQSVLRARDREGSRG